jgi:hypothetical protein
MIAKIKAWFLSTLIGRLYTTIMGIKSDIETGNTGITQEDILDPETLFDKVEEKSSKLFDDVFKED